MSTVHSPQPTDSTNLDRTSRVKRLIETYGGLASAFQVLERGYEYFFYTEDGADRAVIAYVETRWYWVIAGAPIGTEIVKVIDAARRAATDRGRRLLFVACERETITTLQQLDDDFEAVDIGRQPEWDPSSYRTTGSDRRSLRAQINRAKNKGVRVRRIAPDELTRSPGSLRLQVEHVMSRWQESRRMGVLKFMVDLQPFSFRAERRYYLAERDEGPVGFLAAIPVYGRNGWFFEDVIRTEDAPNGTADLLIHTALEDARESRDEYVTLGLCPLAPNPEDDATNVRLRRRLGRAADHFSFLYDFRGLEAFKSRFRPDGWTTQYAVATPGGLGLKAWFALLAVFVPGRLTSFCLDTIRRMLRRLKPRTWVIAILFQLACLIPWTTLLAVADGRYWFGDESIQLAWVSFDTFLVLALTGLAYLAAQERRVTRRFAMFLAGATLTDFVLSSVQALSLHADVVGWAALFVTMGVAGPLLATLFLWALAVSWPISVRSRQ